MNKYLLEMFVTVVETRRITAAAKLLNLTQPAVSQQIRHLEAYFGVPLLTREQQGVRPTPAGDILYNRARQILFQFDSLEREIDDITNADDREIVVGATPTAGNFALPCSVWTFKDKFPKANLRLEIGGNGDLAERVLTRTVHIAIIEGNVPPHVISSQGVKSRCIFKDRVIMIAPARTNWAKSRLTLESLVKAPLVVPGKGMGIGMAFESALVQHGIELKDLNVMGQLGGVEGMKAAVEAHGGVMVCAQMAVQKELKRSAYKDVTPVEMNIDLPFNLVCLEEFLPPAARRFIRFIAVPEEFSSCWT